MKKVYICQIVRGEIETHEEGTARVTEISEYLRAVCNNQHLTFWKHTGFWNVLRQIFCKDGVHFNDLGNY